jgi:hypothetical protein
MVFARGLDDHVARLAKELDTIVQQTKADSASFFVFLVDEADKFAPKLEELATKQTLKAVPMTVAVKNQGVERFKVATDAWVTVLFYSGKKAEQTLSWTKEKFDAAAVNKILAEAKKQAKIAS